MKANLSHLMANLEINIPKNIPSIEDQWLGQDQAAIAP
jgi:hypothetical protein